MNPPSVDVVDMLESSDLGLVFATNLFVGHEPPTPDECVTVYDTPGGSPQLTMENSPYFYPTVSIRVRSMSYTRGFDLVNSIKEELHGLSHQLWNGSYYSVISCAQEPFHMDFDERKRPRFVVNFNIQRS